jgi:hypothetical protein
MAVAAREAMGKTKLQAFADRGYFNGLEIKACEDAGITAFVPKPMTSNAKAHGRFSKADFIYIAKDDEYRVPCWSASHLPVQSIGGQPGPASLLDQRLSKLRPERSVHHRICPTHPPLGARSRD